MFLTADSNQTIYGASMAWQKVSDALSFRGRTRVLRKNYRTTHETWAAIRPIAAGIPDIDPETLDTEPAFHGPVPKLGTYRSWEEEAKRINEWLRQSLLAERMSANCAAVLCATNRDCERLAKLLDPCLQARAFTTKNLELSHGGVKVMTMHAAKGLQFPVVAVTGLDEGWFPRPAQGGMDPDEHRQKLQRVFFVACSRAMRRLLVCGHALRPSPFLELLDRDDWETDD